MAVNPLFANFNFNFFEEVDDAEERENIRLKFVSIRDSSNPFEMPNKTFLKLFRLSKPATFHLIEEIKQIMPEPVRKDTIPIHLQVFASLLFFAQGNYQTTIGEDVNLGISQPAVSRIINKISDIMTNHLLQRYVKFPCTDEETTVKKEGFYNANFTFPNVIGAIDCTHIAIVSPKINDPINPAIAYLNRKGFYSINVQTIFDAQLVIMNINARYPGATHDSAIWETSTIHNHMRRKYREGRRNCFILGDSGYPIQPWLLTPFLNPEPNSPEALFNEEHIQTRNVAERGFGVLKARFRCLRKDRVLHYHHSVAGRIVYSCAVLHNICRQFNVAEYVEDFENGNDDDFNHNPELQQGAREPRNQIANHNNDLAEGRFIRLQVANDINRRRNIH